MASKYLSSLSKDEYRELTEKLWSIQNKKCFICEEEINLDLHSTNIDHIIPLANKGKDGEENFALTHESCNKSKQDANLKIAKVLNQNGKQLNQLNNTIYRERIKKYQKEHNLKDDDFNFSEAELVEYFKEDSTNVKGHIIDAIKHSITYPQDNKLKDYIDFEGKAKDLPISYSAFDKTILSTFISSKLILKTPINYKVDDGLNPRELEIKQIIKLLNILAEIIYINKFKPEIGVSRIEKKIIDKKDSDITDEHLIAFRISKEEIMHNWLQYLMGVIKSYFMTMGKMVEDEGIFQNQFDEQLWTNIRNFINNLYSLPLWKDRGMSSTVFAGKNNYDYWKTIFETAKAPNGAVILAKPLNFMEMIQS